MREAIARCAREQLDKAVRELSEGIGEDPVASVHAVRTAFKKERSLLRLSAVRLRVDDWKLTRGGWDAIEPGVLLSYRQGSQGLDHARDAPSLNAQDAGSLADLLGATMTSASCARS